MPDFPLLVNFYGGPGCGKSSMALGVTSICKWRGIEAEYVPEVPKDLVYEENWNVLENQLKVLGDQWQRIHRLVKHRKIIVTDSPIIIQTLYNKKYIPEFNAMVTALHNTFPSLNYLLTRKKEYDPAGRYQTEEQAKDLDVVALNRLMQFKIPYTVIDGIEANAEVIYQHILAYMREVEDKHVKAVASSYSLKQS